MKMTMHDLEGRIREALLQRGISDVGNIAWATVWLEACGYPGLGMLAEALADESHDLALARDAIGLDLQHVSCVFLAPAIAADVRANGRAFLRNVRHGLFLLPHSVRDNMGIGCPVDPAFALGGERLKNPYAEKLALAQAEGIEVDEAQLEAIA